MWRTFYGREFHSSGGGESGHHKKNVVRSVGGLARAFPSDMVLRAEAEPDRIAADRRPDGASDRWARDVALEEQTVKTESRCAPAFPSRWNYLIE